MVRPISLRKTGFRVLFANPGFPGFCISAEVRPTIGPQRTPKDHELRGTIIGGEPWFVAKDACDILGLRGAGGASYHLKAIDADEKGMAKVATPGGKQVMTIVSRPGLFKLIARSSKPEAKAFDRWVRHEVLPQIMDNGGYVTADANAASASSGSIRQIVQRSIETPGSVLLPETGFRVAFANPRFSWVLH